MVTCSGCGRRNPDDARYCSACAAPLAAAPPPGREERRVVTTLFCDLVGSTAQAERLDPEDVRAHLASYHARVRSELERHGGTVEKFIGDAVMALFGAPHAHEDDPERAVRAALAIRDAARDGDADFEVRIGITTGEALVALGAQPHEGEGMASGDVVNTAARLQVAAPVNAVLVDEATYRATRDAVDYGESGPVEAKGKSQPIATWEALEARSRFGVDVRQLVRTKLVGRDEELAVLVGAMDDIVRRRSPRLVTLVGVPGIGKSRLVFELFLAVEALPELITWRQGRSLPYGDGVSFWALGEMTKAHAGILETDSADEAEAKLRGTVEAAIDDGGDVEWVLTHLRPLVGLARDETVREGRRAEAFFAWRRFFEALARQGPLVLVFEDLHWADEGLLDFLDHLAEWATDVPLLIVATARPELYERRPGFGRDTPGASSVMLRPLEDKDAARLIAGLLEQAVLPAEIQAALLQRAGGNPLYAEQYVRMLADRGFLQRADGIWTLERTDELPVPENVQAIIAARLDALPVEEKALLQDAAVVGKVLWTGALAAIGGSDRWSLEEQLHTLARKDFLRQDRRSSVGGESEYAFLHVLVRDVAYGSIPRAQRSEKHRLVAEWIESLSEDRAEDHAELLAHHYGHALELARAAGAGDAVQRLEEHARRFLILAGDRAVRLDLARAEAYYRRALASIPEGDPDRARVMAKVADTAQEDFRLREAVDMYEEAIPELQAAGDMRAAGEAMVKLATALWRLGDTAESGNLLARAVVLLELEPPGPALARAYTRTATNHVLGGRSRDGLEWATKALDLAQQLGLHDQIVRTRQMMGIARCDLGDWKAGLEDLREALRLGLAHGLGWETSTAYANLGEMLYRSERVSTGLELTREGGAHAERRGLTHHVWWTKGNVASMLFELGEWDEALRTLDEVTEWDRRGGGSQLEVMAGVTLATVLAWKGELARADSLMTELLPRAHSIADTQTVAPSLITAAIVAHGRGDSAAAVRLVEEFEERTSDTLSFRTDLLPEVMRLCAATGAVDLAARLLESVSRDDLPARQRNAILSGRAVLAEAQGDLDEAAVLYAEAAAMWADWGSKPEHALALVGRGRCLLALARRTEATVPLTEARQLLAPVGAAPVLAEIDVLLEQATEQVS